MADLGTDTSCITDMRDDAGTVTGRMCLGEAIARRLITPRGRLLDDPNYGYDLRQYLNSDLGPSDIARITASVKAECLKDERVVTATPTVTLAGRVLIVSVVIDDGDGPFTLVLSIDAVTVQILQVGP